MTAKHSPASAGTNIHHTHTLPHSMNATGGGLHSRIRRACLALAVALFAYPTPEAGAATFEVSGARLLKDGQEFVVQGVGINGKNCWWPRDNSQDADLIADCWRFNTVRSSCRLGGDPVQSDLIERLVDAFTSRGVVIMFEIHDFTGKYPDQSQLEQLSSWHKGLAAKYKDNSLVWFNVMNEPGTTPCSPKWLSCHETVIEAIRSTGNTSVIVCDGTAWGQDVGTWNSSINENNSALLTYGKTLAGKYDNILFSTHLYDQWVYGDDKMIEYIRRVREEGLCMIFGEYGIDNGNHNTSAAVKSMFRVAPPRNVGRIAWHWDGGDGNKLTDAEHPAGGWRIDRTDGQKPTNLSEFGEWIWDDTHQPTTVTIAEPLIPGARRPGAASVVDISGRALRYDGKARAVGIHVAPPSHGKRGHADATVKTHIAPEHR